MKCSCSNLWRLQRVKNAAAFKKLSKAWKEIRRGGNKMDAKQAVIVLQGNVQLNAKPNTTYSWFGPVFMDRELKFREAYEIERDDWNNGIQGCIYQVGTMVSRAASIRLRGGNLRTCLLRRGRPLQNIRMTTKSVSTWTERSFYSPIPVFQPLIMQIGYGTAPVISRYMKLKTKSSCSPAATVLRFHELKFTLVWKNLSPVSTGGCLF